MDCFAALAMTVSTHAFYSRDADCARGVDETPPQERGRRESRVHAAPAVSCARCTKENAHEHTGSAEAIRPSLRNGFTAYVVISPAIGLFCHRRLRKSLSANLTPASRRQDHTILPSASKALSSEAPPAATASSPASVTIAIRPSSGVDGGGYRVICGFGKPEYFFGRGWTGRNSLIRLEKLDFRRKSAEARRDGPQPRSSRRRACAERARTSAGGLIIRSSE